MDVKKILGIIPTVQAAQLAGSNIDDFKDFKKKKTGHGITKTAIKDIVGLELIRAEAGLIGTF